MPGLALSPLECRVSFGLQMNSWSEVTFTDS
jgi:hypothetical protein